MLVFITHPKFFEKRMLYRKKVDLIYIFDSDLLYKDLKKRYRCINLDKDYRIKNENFFPPPSKRKIKNFAYHMLSLKKKTYSYFKKKEHSYKSKKFRMLGGYKDSMHRIIINICNDLEKHNVQEAYKFIEEKIWDMVMTILEFEKGEEFCQQNRVLIEKLLNLSNSLYRSYIYSFCGIRGSEGYGDVFKYNYFLNTVLHYTFDKYDIYKNDFHYDYRKVLMRLFIEHIHKNDIKNFVKNYIEYVRREEWL